IGVAQLVEPGSTCCSLLSEELTGGMHLERSAGADDDEIIPSARADRVEAGSTEYVVLHGASENVVLASLAVEEGALRRAGIDSQVVGAQRVQRAGEPLPDLVPQQDGDRVDAVLRTPGHRTRHRADAPGLVVDYGWERVPGLG